MGKEDRRFFPIPVETQAPPEYGIDAGTVKIKTINLAVARVTPQRIELAGSVLWAVTATSITALVNVALGDAMLSGDPLPVRQGFFVRGIRFSRLYITNTAQAAETITIMMAEEGPDNIQIENPAVMYSEMSLIKATVLDTLIDVSMAAIDRTQILAANPNRQAAVIGALGANTATIRIGDVSVDLNRGTELAPGESITIPATEAIHGFNNDAAAQVVSVLWTED